jgi:hypothetical protein
MCEIAKIERMSIRDISAIIKEEEARRQKYKHQQQRQEISAQAYVLFSEGKTTVQVAIVLNLSASKVSNLYREYWKVGGLDKLNTVYKETNGKLGLFWKLYRLMKEKGMSIEQIVNAVDTAIHKLPYMESLYKQVKYEIDKLQYARQALVNDIEAMKHKISILDITALSCEQDCKRTEQQIQELTDKKDSIEKWIIEMAKKDNDFESIKMMNDLRKY